MSRILVFLRHGQTKVEPKPISEWVLTEEGERQAQRAAENPEMQDVDLIVISSEEKAWQTAKPLIERLERAGKKPEIIRSAQIAELNRDEGGHMNKEEYEKAVHDTLSNRDISVHNWETANHARERFGKEVERIAAENPEKKVLFIGHGYTFGMYFAEKHERLDDRLYDYVHESTFCSWGMVKNGKAEWPIKPYEMERPGEKMV